MEIDLNSCRKQTPKLILIRLDFWRIVFSSGGGGGGWGGGPIDPLPISRGTNLISILLYTIVKQPI